MLQAKNIRRAGIALATLAALGHVGLFLYWLCHWLPLRDGHAGEHIVLGAGGVVWLVAALGIATQRYWGTGFNLALLVYSAPVMAAITSDFGQPSALMLLPIGLFAGLIIASLARRREGPRTVHWQKQFLAFGIGLMTPLLALGLGFFPAVVAEVPLIAAGIALAALGSVAVMSGRTVGLLLITAAVPCFAFELPLISAGLFVLVLPFAPAIVRKLARPDPTA